MRRIKSIISLVLALILACAAALPISAAGPLTGDSLYINTHIDAINSATGKNYLSDTGDTMDFLKLKAYDQNPVYCIEKGARFTRTLYKAQTLANSAYWKKLTEKAREGIALCRGFRLSRAIIFGARRAVGRRRIYRNSVYYLGVSAGIKNSARRTNCGQALQSQNSRHSC